MTFTPPYPTIVPVKHFYLAVFIMYAQEEDDPNGEKLFSFNKALCFCGVNSDTDLYHATESINDWNYWVSKSMEHCIAADGYILLICSPAMITILEDTGDNAKVQMVYGHIDRLTLRHFIVSNTTRFLPVFISDHFDPKYAPPSLSGRKFYHFPYELMDRIPQNISPQGLLDYRGFDSFRSLVATLTGQQESCPIHIGEGMFVQYIDVMHKVHSVYCFTVCYTSV